MDTIIQSGPFVFLGIAIALVIVFAIRFRPQIVSAEQRAAAFVSTAENKIAEAPGVAAIALMEHERKSIADMQSQLADRVAAFEKAKSTIAALAGPSLPPLS